MLTFALSAIVIFFVLTLPPPTPMPTLMYSSPALVQNGSEPACGGLPRFLPLLGALEEKQALGSWPGPRGPLHKGCDFKGDLGV